MAQRRVALGLLLLVVAGAVLAWPRPGPATATGVRVQAVSAGGQHTCALLEGGGVKCWGDSGQGQLGAGKDIDGSSRPVDVVNLEEGAVAVSAGGVRTCILTATGGVKCSGANGFGQLGHDRIDLCFFFPCSMVPEYVRTLESGVVAVVSGSQHSCALTTAGGVKCWGLNSGRLGDGGACGEVCTTPIDVPGLQSGVTAISAGAVASCAITTAGGAMCWGSNVTGQLGDGGVCGTVCPPVQVAGLDSGVAEIAVDDGNACVLTKGGSLKCWGYNAYGQLGDGTTNNSTVPVDVVGLGTRVAAVTAGGFHTCALTMAGGVKCWGDNQYGELGLGASDSEPHPVPEDVPGLEQDATAISAGFLHTCAVTSAGAMKCWGANDWGQLGDGRVCSDPNANCPRPVDVVGLGPKPVPTPTATPPEATATPTESAVLPTEPATTPPAATSTQPTAVSLPVTGADGAPRGQIPLWLAALIAAGGASVAGCGALRLLSKEERP